MRCLKKKYHLFIEIKMSLDLVSGEQILFRAKLNDKRWKNHRCFTCSMLCLRSYLGIPFLPFYTLFADPCRQKEADSFELVVTNYNIHFSQKIYQCGTCFQDTHNKIIPLEKIQDIVLVSNCCGDTCGFVDKPGDVYQLHFQTAGQGTPIPELSIFCIENPREFKRMVLEAKQKIVSQTTLTGHAKTSETLPLVHIDQGQQERLFRILEKFESQMDKGDPQNHGEELRNPLLVSKGTI